MADAADPERGDPADAEPDAPWQGFPRVPAPAWAWLQRSRPVLTEVARRLTGQAPDAAFLEGLSARFSDDAFTRAIVCDVIAEVAFSGRVPPKRPAGASWDRGLVWWAATLSGTTPAAYDRRPPAGAQPRLFATVDDDPTPSSLVHRRARAAAESAGGAATAALRRPPVRGERAALAASLRAVLAASDGVSVPADAVRELLRDLEGDGG